MIDPQSEQDGASCWKRIGGAPVRTFGASASRGGRAIGAGVSEETNARSVEVNDTTLPAAEAAAATLDAGGAAASSRLITPASSCASRVMNLMASHLKM